MHRRFDKTGVAQHAQVLRNTRLAHSQLLLDLAHRLLRRSQKPQDRPPIWLRNHLENRIHAMYIPVWLYTCQDIKQQRLAYCRWELITRQKPRVAELPWVLLIPVDLIDRLYRDRRTANASKPTPARIGSAEGGGMLWSGWRCVGAGAGSRFVK